ncbi:MAG: restriction endonuclease subunit S [Kurthia sp.]|nr:restriction endonuclease subunit S [Candidatus Kurthia equi]
MNNVQLKEIVQYSKNRISYDKLNIKTYISTDNLLQNKLGAIQINSLPSSVINTPKYEFGNILVSNIRPYLKKILYAKNEGGVSSDVLTFVVNEGFDPRFVYYNLFQDSFFEHMMAGSKGTKMPRGDKNQILEFEISQFSLQTQQKIAAVLSALDDKIEVNNKINAELEAIAKTLYDYWFVQFEFPNVEGKPYKSSGGEMVYNPTLKREIPEGWEVKELNEIAKVIMGQSPKGESYNEEGNGVLLINGAADYEGNYLKPRIYTSAPTRLCEVNDLVFCIRATIGKLTYAEDKFCLGRGVAGVRVNSLNYTEYIFYSLNQEIERFKKHASGSIIVGITKEDLTDYNVLIPRENILNNFHKILHPIHSKMRMNSKQNQELSQLRDWLLPMLMNGQVTVE